MVSAPPRILDQFARPLPPSDAGRADLRELQAEGKIVVAGGGGDVLV